jgi:hypothetical protein
MKRASSSHSTRSVYCPSANFPRRGGGLNTTKPSAPVEGENLTFDDGAAKLTLVVEAANEIWD